MLGEFWIYLFTVLLAVGLALRNVTLVSIGGIGMVLSCGTWLWSRLAIERITYHRVLSRHRVFQGENVDMEITVDNRKSLPLARVRVADFFPLEIELLGHDLQPSPIPNTLRFSKNTSLGAFERVRWRYQIRGRQRGFYRIGPAELHTGDLFNFFPRVRHSQQEEYLLVYPTPIPLPAMDLVPQRPLGDARGSPWFPQADPSRPAGLREYAPGDPPKYIDWKATARHGTLQVKHFEPGSSTVIALFANADTVGTSYGGMVPINMERIVAVCASLSEELLSKGVPLALYTNSRSVLYDHPMRVPPGSHPQQHSMMLETLSMIGPYVATSIEEMLLDQARKLPAGTTLVLVSGMLTPPLKETLAMLVSSSGGRRRPILIWVAEWEPEDLPAGVILINLHGYLTNLEKRGEAPYMSALEARNIAREEIIFGKQDEVAAEKEHLEARNAPTE